MDNGCSKKRPIEINDLNKVHWINDPQLSPDGSKVLYVQKQSHPTDKTKYTTQIWCVATSGSEPHLMTGETSGNSTPRWSPDGQSIAFNSSRAGTNQIWLLSAFGGEAQQLTKYTRPLTLVAWSPDGSKLLATCKIKPEDLVESKEEKSDVKVITRLHYKMNSVGYHDDRNTHLFVIDAETGEAKQITDGAFDHNSAAWSPDSKQIVFTAKRYDDADYVDYNDLYSVSPEGGEIKKLTNSDGSFSEPSFSHDGKWIAYVGHQNEFGNATMAKIWIMPAAGGEATMICHDFDYSVGGGIGSDMTAGTEIRPAWNQGDSKIFFAATTGCVTRIFTVNVKGSKPEAITSAEKAIYGMSYHAKLGCLAYTLNEPSNMGDLYFATECGCDEKRLTAVNKTWYEEVWTSLPEQYEFTADNGVKLEGWLLKPYGYEEGKKYPMVLEIHGGPHATYGLAFNHEMQCLCGLGYAVLYVNPQGSTGYGQAFNNAIFHDWGGQDYRDLMLAVEKALVKWPWLDAARLGVTGGSYGGYMTNWMIGHTDIFKAAVTLRSTSNRFSMFGTSDIGYKNGSLEFDGNPWVNYEHYLMHSPITYVENIKTPLLMMHSEQDYRCPIEQSEQFFTALKWLKKEVVFVRFPNENHELSRSGQPTHRMERLKHMMGWFTKYIAPNQV